MSTLTDFYYDLFDMWYAYDPFDGSVPDPFCYINDVELRHRAMAITTPSEDLGHYVETLKKFRQSCIDEEYDEFVERADGIAYTYRDLIKNGIANVSDDELDERVKIAKRYAFLYDYYIVFWDDETRAAKFAVKHAEEIPAQDYTDIVAYCVEGIESLFRRYEKDSDWKAHYEHGMELMGAFTKHYGDELYKNNLIEIEDGWAVCAVYNKYNPNLFDHYDYCNLNQEGY